MLGSKRGRQSPSPSPYPGGREESEDRWLYRSSSEVASPAVWSSAKKSRGGTAEEEEQEDVLDTSESALSKSFHLEESLIIAEGNRDRYKIELEAEMDRSAVLAGRIAQLETENAQLTAQAQASALMAASREKELKAESSARESERRASALEVAKIGTDDEKLNLQDQVRTLREALSKAEEERDLAKAEASAAEARASMLGERCEEAQQEAKTNLDLIFKPAPAGADAATQQKITDLETVVRHQSSALESAKAEAREVCELRKAVKRLRGIEDEAQEAKERVGRLEKMLHTMVQAEATLRQERDLLQDWRVTLAVGFRDSSSPSDVIDAFKALREHNLVLEDQLATWQEKARHREREAKENEDARKGEEAARKAAEEELETVKRALALEEGKVKREHAEAEHLRFELGSHKVEEVLVRDLEVQALSKKVKGLEQADAKTKEEMESERRSAKAAAEKLQAEIAKGKAELAKVKEDLAKVNADLSKANADLQKAKAEGTSAREQARQAATAAAMEKRQLQKGKEEAEKKIKEEVEEERKAKEEEKKGKEEALKEVAATKEQMEKVQQEIKETKEKAKRFSDGMIANRRKQEDFERVFPYLFGFSYKYQAGKPKEGAKERLLVISLKTSFSEKEQSFMIKAVVPPEADKAPSVQLQDGSLPDALKSLKEKYIAGSVGTAAKHAGLPAFLASLVGTDFDRLVQQKKEDAAAKEAAAGSGVKKEAADGSAAPAQASADGGAQASDARAGSKSPVLTPGSSS